MLITDVCMFSQLINEWKNQKYILVIFNISSLMRLQITKTSTEGWVGKQISKQKRFSNVCVWVCVCVCSYLRLVPHSYWLYVNDYTHTHTYLCHLATMFWWELRRFCPLIMWSGLHIKRISRRQQLRLWICSPAHGKFTFYTFLLKTRSEILNYTVVLSWLKCLFFLSQDL